MPLFHFGTKIMESTGYLERILARYFVATGPIIVSGKRAHGLSNLFAEYLDAMLLLAQLPREQQQVLLLYCGDHLAEEEIAKALNIPARRVGRLLYQGAIKFYDLKWPYGKH